MKGTLSLDNASNRSWDAIVIGAGPAGGIVAKGLADRGLSVALVESKSFPRYKPCGGCLNGASLAALAAAGMGSRIDAIGPVPLHAFHMAAAGKHVRLSLPRGVAVSRCAMDAAIAGAAIDAGAAFLPETTATVGPVDRQARRVILEAHGRRLVADARVVVVASGLGGRSLAQIPELQSRAVPSSRIGVAAALRDKSEDYSAGGIFMAVGRHGYVGLTRTEDSCLTIAAAVDRLATRRAGGPAAACRDILAEAGFPTPRGMCQAEWYGTPALTRRAPNQAAERLFLVGDAAGYVEPVTGEGMAWALASGIEVVPFVCRSVSRWTGHLVGEWEHRYRLRIEHRQWTCLAIAAGLRRTKLVTTSVRVLSRMPWMAKPIVDLLNRASFVSFG